MSATDGLPGVAAASGAADTPPASAPGERGSIDAVVSIAWLIVANKPVYPLYVWWVVGSGTAAAYLTAVATPAFLAIALFGRRRPLAAALALPLVGAVDTVFAVALFGTASGAELFFVPCVLLALLGVPAREASRVKILVAVLFVGFVAAHRMLGDPFGPWTAAEAARLFDVNVYAVASLSAFIGWRFSDQHR